jgi:hypothetical protein
MSSIGQASCWRLDLVGAWPAGKGYGGTLIRRFVSMADAAGATVYLVCEPRNRVFYRRAGFFAIEAPDTRDFRNMVLMRRTAPTVRAVPA